jgi:hypothetical protein
MIFVFLWVRMGYSKNQTKILFLNEFNENKLNYICIYEMSIAKMEYKHSKRYMQPERSEQAKQLHVTDKKQ